MNIGNYLFRKYTQPQRLLLIVVLMSAVAGVTALVWITGGIKYVYSHSMYIPIAIAGIIFGYKGGIIIGLIGGIALGPWMPINTETMEMQDTINWVYRTFYFVAVGTLAGLSSDTSRRYIERLKQLARRDPVSKLPNRKALLERLQDLRDSHELTTQNYFLVTCSIDNGMALRSAFGFTVIDAIIQSYAKALQAMSAHQPEVFRIHAGQLAALFPNIAANDTDAVMNECLSTLRENANFENLSVYVNRHLGGVFLNDLSIEPATLLQHAEIAIARANDKMMDSFIYTPEVSETISKHLALMAEVSEGIERGDFLMHYQPKLELASGKVFGVEALIRWHHPERGWIRPDEFIPSAEHSTLILKISEFVLREVIQQTSAWQKQGVYLQVAINVTGHDLLQPGFSQMLFDLLSEYDVDGNWIEIEITEGTLIEDIDDVVAELLKLAKAKITVSIDDFGTGYSSLQYLYKLPISLLKIDQVFVKTLPDDEGASHICAAAVVLAQKMGIKSLAEGVETEAHLNYLRELGCDYGQGYLFCKPLGADEFIDWYRSHQDHEQQLG
ncbi:putative bifunctional diguanylate cyclase/phosphodiesterase [Pseudidiomarina homiensis]|uniref:GGDEF domain-containing protein n=1 Tax=Pseudidiomarina homiensis TaxID=364198 RepID=A0A432Y783_9GAMM|nr:bifunctional diguanylate cyclase/phosphodiesterase [Pseudidiomarina homiensis]RUO56839.1 GGDEF domain-containing protein [Pseudidiomarina homiensis]